MNTTSEGQEFTVEDEKGLSLLAKQFEASPRARKRLLVAFFILLPLAFIPALLGLIFRWRLLGASVMVITALIWVVGLLLLPMLAASRMTRALFRVAQGEESLPALSPMAMARNFFWQEIFRSRWLICLLLAVLPALLLSLYRSDLAHFTLWQSSALTLGSAAEAANSALLLPGGGIPMLRLLLRVLFLGVLLPLLGAHAITFGILSACFRPEPGRAMLLALLATAVLSLLLLVGWQVFSLDPTFAGWAEAIRLLLMVFFTAGLLLLRGLFNSLIARQLA